jgi:DNA-binding transcriptional LysR family regulator
MRYFESVVRNKKITKAAEELHISQPSLSAQIKILEEMLGCKLLERKGREISLTEEGKVLYKHACNLLLQFENVFKEIEDVKKVESGEIRIGLFPSAAYWFPNIINQIKIKYPYLNIKISETGAENIEDSLLNYDIHLGITSKLNNSNKLSFTPIYNEELMLITYDSHPFAGLNQIDINELSKEIFIQYKPGYQIREIIQKTCQNAGFEPQVICECGRLETVKSMVISKLGVAIVPETYIKFGDFSEFNVLNIINPTPSRTLYLVFQQDRYYQPIIHELKKLIFDYFKYR